MWVVESNRSRARDYRAAAAIATVVWFSSCPTVQAADAPPPEAPVDAPLLYAPRPNAPMGQDCVTLTDGSKWIGKVLEWGNEVLVIDAGDSPRRLPAENVRSIEIRPTGPAAGRPAQPDLTVASVASIGSTTGPGGKLRIRVTNASKTTAKPFDCRVLLDGRQIAAGRFTQPLEPGTGSILDLPAAEPLGTGILSIEVDVKHENADANTWNNRYVTPLSGRRLLVIIPADRYAQFASVRSLVDTFCLEDWLNYHVRCFNRLLADSVYPGAPRGVQDCLRLVHLAVTGPLRPDAEKDRPALLRAAGATEAEFDDLVVFNPPADRSTADLAARVDWAFMRQLGRAWGLVDLSNFDVAVDRGMVRDSNGDFVQTQYRMPWPRSFMYPVGSRLFSELEVAYLNRTVGKRREPGEYLRVLPAQCVLRVLDNAGRPLPAVEVSVFQRSGTGPTRDTMPDTEVFVGQTDANGLFALPPREAPATSSTNGFAQSPNPWGPILADGSNGTFFVRLRKGASEEYHFVTLLDFVRACMHGGTARHERVLRTRLASGGPEAPSYSRALANALAPADPNVFVYWPICKTATIREYRLYARTERDASGWKLVNLVSPSRVGVGGAVSSTVPIESPAPTGRADEDHSGTHFATTAVDDQGREGPLSPPCFVPHSGREVTKAAVSPSGAIVYALSGLISRGLVQKLPGRLEDDFGLRWTRFPDYEPWSGGIAFDHRGRLVMTDPHNHQVGWYERGELVRLVGDPRRNPRAASKTPGVFDAPEDVAIDERDQVYIADTGNNRLQVLDADGKFLRLFTIEGDFDLFKRPRALGCYLDKLCVTDLDGERIQIYDISGAQPKLFRVFRNLRDADRAQVGESGRVYVPARNAEGKWSVLIYPKETPADGVEKPERDVPRVAQGWVRAPRGFAPDGKGYGFYVTEYPFTIQRFMLE